MQRAGHTRCRLVQTSPDSTAMDGRCQLRRRYAMKTRLWLVAGAAAAIMGVTGLSAYADLFQDLVGILPGGSNALLPPAAIVNDTDPVPPGAQKMAYYASTPFGATCPGGATVTN